MDRNGDTAGLLSASSSWERWRWAVILFGAGAGVVGLTRVGGLGMCAFWVAGHGYIKDPLSALGEGKPGPAPRVSESGL